MDRLSENAQVAASGKCSIKKWAKDWGLRNIEMVQKVLSYLYILKFCTLRYDIRIPFLEH